MGARFMSVGKGKDRKSFPITKPKGTSKTRFNKKSTGTKSRFKFPTLPNDPPRNPTVDELTPSERKRALNILNMLDSSGSGLDKEGKEMKKQLERKSKISTLPNDPPRSDMDDEDQEPIVAQFSKGDTVMIEPDNDNENYDEFRNKKLRITNVAINRDEHRGFDEGVGQALYDLETIHGKEVGFSLYDYELVSA